MDTADNMACPKCGNASKRFGRHRNGLQRFRCLVCNKTFTEPHKVKPTFRIEDYLKTDHGMMAVRMLVEGCSIRTVERITGIRAASLCRLLVIVGERCERFLSSRIRNVPATDVQADEIWGFVGKKEKNKGPDEAHNDSLGDCYTWVAIERNTKLVLAFVVGRRTSECAALFMGRLRLATNANTRFQLTTDGLQTYVSAVDEFLLDRCDYAMLVKTYAEPQEPERRYSPADCTGAKKVVISGNPDESKICTSHVERQNLTMRMQIRRLTRLTNGFSKNVEGHRAAIALHFANYNFCQIHGSLRVTPAMEAGVTDHVWKLAEVLAA